MRFLILSDIHGNLAALEAVMTSVEGRFDEIVCLGDIVGYGADPNDTARWVRDQVRHVIRGNHDRACTGDPNIEEFQDNARAAALWTYSVLEEDSMRFLRSLRQGPEKISGFWIAHGSPRDEDEYICDKYDAQRIFRHIPGDLCFFGHTHLQGGFGLRPGRAWDVYGPEERSQRTVLEIEPDTVYLINPGSVGQPRDGDPRAAYALYDEEARTIALERVPYDIGRTQERIVAAKLPPFLADRLSDGQ